MPRIWAGIDAGKRSHHCVVLDEHGDVLLSRKVDNDETALLELIGSVASIAAGGQACWATDLNAGGAAMLIALLAAHDQYLLYLPGRIVHHAAATYRGDGKTDAKDARIIADQARMRTDLQPVRRSDPIATDLRMLTARRTDVVCDRVRAINRLRSTMLEYFPVLERAFDYSKSKAALTLLSGYQTPEALRRIGSARLAAPATAPPSPRWPSTPHTPNGARCPPRRSERSWWPHLPPRSPRSTTNSSRSTSISPTASNTTRAPRSSPACRDSGPCWPRRSSRRSAATSMASTRWTGWPASPS